MVLIVATPFISAMPRGDLFETALVGMVLLSAVPAIGAQRRVFWTAMALAVPAVAAKLLYHVAPAAVPKAAFLIPGLLCLTYVLLHLLRFILIAPRVDSEVLCAGVAGYLMMAILWGAAYTLIEQLAPGSFNFSVPADKSLEGFTSLYFSFGVLGTVGFGDIVPVSRVARLFAVLEATLGMFYVAILISRLVSLYRQESNDSASA